MLAYIHIPKQRDLNDFLSNGFLSRHNLFQLVNFYILIISKSRHIQTFQDSVISAKISELNMAAVIGSEINQSVFSSACLVKVLQNFSHWPIKFLDGVTINTVSRTAFELFRNVYIYVCMDPAGNQ